MIFIYFSFITIKIMEIINKLTLYFKSVYNLSSNIINNNIYELYISKKFEIIHTQIKELN